MVEGESAANGSLALMVLQDVVLLHLNTVTGGDVFQYCCILAIDVEQVS